MPSSPIHFDTVAAIDAVLDNSLPEMIPFMERLFPIGRSITGPGVRETLDLIGERIPLERARVPSGTQCFDWIVPDEWTIREAYIRDAAGKTVVDYRAHNLHVVSYSTPVRATLSLAELQEHLHSDPAFPEAIPYRTSYYTPYWGFCMSHDQREGLAEGDYEVVIDSTLEPGHLDYAQCRIPGATHEEILLSTYVCHPSMANNELSGPVLLTALMSVLEGLPCGAYSYRGVFTPETIGTIAFLAEHRADLQRQVAAGYVISCVGDDGPYTYVRSRQGGTMADTAAEHVMKHVGAEYAVDVRDFDPVGSDERQYGSPGINLPVGSLLRSRHGEYREYHTSKDDLDFVSEKGLAGALTAYLRIIQTLEMNCRPVRTNPYCEPQLGRRGLYSSLGTEGVEDHIVKMLNLLAFADSETDLITIADRVGCPIWELRPPLQRLVDADLLVLER